MEKSGAEEIAKVTIKKEVLNDDIKEFAETAMNELLGWYGYANNNHRDARACKSHSGSNSSGPPSPKFNEGCGWCGKAVDENTGLSSAAATFCSELCFSQSRRANFKKNKTCDWCRHVRHTVSYVDSQDGSSQLQFCSDKCLNQYKMHIFWRETRAHLEMHPHVHGEESSSGTLITPDLWMSKCKSPEVQVSSPSSSPKLGENSQQTSPLPLITVAHPSKLMSVQEAEPKRHRNKVQKKKKRNVNLPSCTSTNKTFSSDMPQDLRIRHTPTDFEANRLNSEDANKTQPEGASRLSQTQYFCNSEAAAHRKLMDNLVPPPTILVPYPLILPLPLPIPIPIPLPFPKGLLNKVRDDGGKSQDASCQTGEELISSQIVSEKVEDNTGINSIRPLRKRKRIVEKKSKFLLKNKKILST
ncbi:sine oculis-binding protein homolog [Tribolium castaneum]|uniref:Sine oculis-binding protein n=1 Tax=Tribolium castaneum TaxID=7070 RepID=D6WA41_TRICA|nr:PREDICTED: sine oculis-binding protein homolog [Tribolium castaneum]EEZ99201.1 sine oculis-binding protein [Tribolium castaneum]|eukprot:XP_967801.1 PREDICTED: sine oculis-binding protein homolog [Tribolium castaneum]